VLAEVLERLVRREAGADRRDLEQHARWLPEVDRAEVEAVDYRGRVEPGLGDPLAPRLVLLGSGRPRDVVNGAGRLHAAVGGRLVVYVEPAAPLAARLPALVAGGESERLLEVGAAALRVGGVGAHRVEALERQLGRDLRVLGCQRLVVDVGDEQLVLEPLVVGEPELIAVALRLVACVAEALRPEVERVARCDPPVDPVHHSRACAADGHARELEEGQVRARIALLVGVEQVIDGGLVLVDGLLDQPQAERARVEVDVLRRVGGDRGYVMDAFELHGGTPVPRCEGLLLG
jgi:hypothetical protein